MLLTWRIDRSFFFVFNKRCSFLFASRCSVSTSTSVVMYSLSVLLPSFNSIPTSSPHLESVKPRGNFLWACVLLLRSDFERLFDSVFTSFWIFKFISFTHIFSFFFFFINKFARPPSCYWIYLCNQPGPQMKLHFEIIIFILIFGIHYFLAAYIWIST